MFDFVLVHSCIAAAASVAAEHKFSARRHTYNFMQHNMSDDTFCARMALSSWQGTPLFPGIDQVAQWISDRMSHSRL
jgi:hypothetical protein